MTDMIIGDLGIQIIKILQTLSPLYDNFFLIFSLFGDTYFYVIIVSLIYWLGSKKTAIHLASVLIISGYVNTLIKNIFGWQRPYIAHPDQVKFITSASGYSFVSGHAQSTGTFWSALLFFYKSTSYKKLLLIMTILFFIFVPLSRVYLAVHYPSDVIIGFLLGIAIFYIYIKISPKIIESLKEKKFGILVSLIVITSGLMLIFEIGVIMITGNDLYISNSTGSMSAVFLGAILGYLFDLNYLNFSNKPSRRIFIITRITIGSILIVVGYLLPNLLLKSILGVEIEIMRSFIQFFLIGFSISFLTPYIFTKMEDMLIKEEISSER